MAWHIFYDAYFDRLWRYLLVVATGNEDSAREALSATFVRVTRHIKVFTDKEVFWCWLTVLARNAFIDETRKQRRYFSFLKRFTSHAQVEVAGLNNEMADERLRILLERQVAILPVDEQKLVGQKYVAHRSVREIANDLQMTEKSVESKLSRIRAKLKDAALAALRSEAKGNE